MLAGRGESLTGVISIMIPDEMVYGRIRHRAEIEGRADDASDEIVRTRIATYHAKTEPLIDYYRARGEYFEVDGTGGIEDVRDRIFSLIDNI